MENNQSSNGNVNSSFENPLTADEIKMLKEYVTSGFLNGKVQKKIAPFWNEVSDDETDVDWIEISTIEADDSDDSAAAASAAADSDEMKIDASEEEKKHR